MTGRAAPEELNAIVDHVFSFQPNRTSAPPPPRHWSVSIERIFADRGLRLDVTRFNPDLDECLEELRGCGHELVPLEELAKIDLPNRFERIWASDEKHGVPYLNATDLLSLFALGVPGQIRFLSRETNTDIEALVIRKDWLLMTCSGTLGRIFHVPKRLDGWVATHDLIRIRPQPGMVGYLFAWCMTKQAQTQVLSHTHGGQIDHVTQDHVASMLVPMLDSASIRDLDNSVLKAIRMREQSIERLESIWPEM